MSAFGQLPALEKQRERLNRQWQQQQQQQQQQVVLHQLSVGLLGSLGRHGCLLLSNLNEEATFCRVGSTVSPR